MNVSLTPELEAFVRGKVESGMYNNASEVVREALRLMNREEDQRIIAATPPRVAGDVRFTKDEDRVAWLRAALIAAREEAARGNVVPVTPRLMDEIFAEAVEAARLDGSVTDELLP